MKHRPIIVCLRVLIACLAMAALPSAWGQQSPSAKPGVLDLQAPYLDWSHARTAFGVAERWVAAGEIDLLEPLPTVEVAGLSGVRVTLRWLGMTVGVGDALAPEGTRPETAMDLMPLVRAATQEALDAVSQSLEQRRREAGVGPQGAGPKDVREISAGLLLDLQLAKALEPINLPADAKDHAIYHRFVPGFHGLKVSQTAESATIAPVWIWPASAIASNIPPRSQLVHAATQLGTPANQVRNVGKPGGLKVERFEVEHMVRPERHLPATRLVRGNVLLPPTSVTARTLEDLAQRVTAHLSKRMRENGTLTGTFEPTSNRYDPETAAPDEAALALYAMGLRAGWLRRTQPGGLAEAKLIEQVNRGVGPLAAELGQFDGPMMLGASALLALTVTQTPGMEGQKALRDQLAARILDSMNPDGSIRSRNALDAPPLSEHTHALALAGLVSVYDQTRDPELLNALQRGRQWIWGKFEHDALVEAQPWLAQVELTVARLTEAATPEQQKLRDQRMISLGAMVDHLLAAQIKSPPAEGPADVVGGFVLDPSPVNPNAIGPDWRSTLYLSFLAQLLREPMFTMGRDRLGWLIQCGQAARFVAQLSFDEPSCFYVRSPSEAMGGIRASLTDNRLSVTASAMALAAVTQLQESLVGLDPDQVIWHADELK